MRSQFGETYANYAHQTAALVPYLSDRHVSRATLTLGMGPHSFDPPRIKARKHCILHRAEVEASTLRECFYCFATFAPTEISGGLMTARGALSEV